MALQPEKHTLKGGRAARRAARVNAPVVHQPALMRNVPVYEVVNAEGVEQIHDLAMRIVERIGVDFRDAESLDIWKKTDGKIFRIFYKVWSYYITWFNVLCNI